MAIRTMQTSPVDATASDPLPDQETYAKAVEYLRELSRGDDEKRWALRGTDIAWARRRLRRKQGLPPEDLSQFEKEEIELAAIDHTRSRGGRIVKKTARTINGEAQWKKRKL